MVVSFVQLRRCLFLTIVLACLVPAMALARQATTALVVGEGLAKADIEKLVSEDGELQRPDAKIKLVDGQPRFDDDIVKALLAREDLLDQSYLAMKSFARNEKAVLVIKIYDEDGGNPLIYDRKTYAVTESVAEFVAQGRANHLFAVSFKGSAGIDTMKQVIVECKKKEIAPERFFEPSKWICRKCYRELPGSFIMALMQPDMQIMGGGSAAAREQFVKDKQCPRCQSDEFCLIALRQPTADDAKVTAADLEAIRAYYKHLADLWWPTHPGSGICDSCNETVAHGEGYIVGSLTNGMLRANRLVCNECIKRYQSDEALKGLQKDPNYMGTGLLEKARAYAKEQKEK